MSSCAEGQGCPHQGSLLPKGGVCVCRGCVNPTELPAGSRLPPASLLPEDPFVHSFAGYQTRGCSQPNEVNITLKMLVSAAPVGLILLGLLLFSLYPINEEKRMENKKALQDLR